MAVANIKNTILRRSIVVLIAVPLTLLSLVVHVAGALAENSPRFFRWVVDDIRNGMGQLFEAIQIAWRGDTDDEFEAE